jgi:hypothetical protein
MSAAEVRLAALEEGNQMGLFSLGPLGYFSLSSAPCTLISKEYRTQIEHAALLTLHAAVGNTLSLARYSLFLQT